MASIRTSVMLNDMMSRQFYAMNAALSTVIDSFYQLQDVTSHAVNISALEAAQRELQQVEASFKQLETEIRQAERAQEQFNRTIQHADNVASKLLRTVGAIAGVYLSFRGLTEAIQLSDEFANTQARIQLLVDETPLMNAVDGLSKAEQVQRMIFDAAQRTYSSYNDMVNVIYRLGTNARDAFGSIEEVVKFGELVQKQFVIAGASTIEAQNAMIQLTQALASGVLRGDELNSIFEQAPNLIQSIADYLNVPVGQIRELAADGKITANIVKNAMFAAADEINARFATMPVTWSQLWVTFKNEALMAFQPVLQQINAIANSERFQAFMQDVTRAMYALAAAASIALEIASNVGAFLYDNWSIVGPLILGVAGALLTLYSSLKLVQYAILAVAAAKQLWATITAAHPIAWLIAGLVALIGVLYAVVGAINKFTGASLSATGIIAGAFAVLGAFIWNTVVGVINAVIQFLWANFAQPAIGIIEWMLNVWLGGFNNWADAIKNLIGQIISWFLSLAQVVTRVTDAIFGTNWSAGLESLKQRVLSWGKNQQAITLDRTAPAIQRISYQEAWRKGYDWGASLFKTGVGGFEGWRAEQQWQNDVLSRLNANNIAAKDTAENTRRLADSVNMLEDDLKYLRDLAERDTVNRFTTAEVKIEMNNQNYINSELDIDGLIDNLVEKAEEAANMMAVGVY